MPPKSIQLSSICRSICSTHGIAISLFLALWLTGCGSSSHRASNTPFWAQWASTPQHTGQVTVAAQALNNKLTDIVYDPFVPQEQTEEFGELVAHFEATLTDGNDFYMESKSGNYQPCSSPGNWLLGEVCGPNAWNQLIWNVTRYTWENGKPVLIWTFQSDWKPEPNDANVLAGSAGLFGWEPVFHPLLANSFLYAPGAGGTIWKVDKNTGKSVSQINPFSGSNNVPANTFVSGPLTADASGNIYYNVIWLAAASDPWFTSDVLGAWLVKVTPDDTPTTASFASIVPNAPAAGSSNCPGIFNSLIPLPWPPTPTAVPSTVLCGSQRPGLNVAPVVSSDGNTIYTVSRAHFDNMVSYLVAVNSDLTPKWQASLQTLLHDGCGVLLPISSDPTTPSSCPTGTTLGVDPTTNAAGSGLVSDQASSTPTVLPDGSILFGTVDNYNYGRGHLFKFDANGNFLKAFTFGWDSTPAVYSHDGTYSIVIKDNHYQAAAYCQDPTSPVCTPPATPGPFYITQVDADLNIEWQFKSTTIDTNHSNGYEWCVNAPAIDSNGVVYANSEDGNVYSIPQGNSGIFSTPMQKIFLKQAIGAAYTPLSLGADGKLYVQNDGHLFVVGN